jgi:integrase
LENVAQNLYRHKGNKKYYAVKKFGSKRKVHCLSTTDRITANGKLTRWIQELTETDQGAADLKLSALVDRYVSARKGLARHTGQCDHSRAKVFRETFQGGMGMPVTMVRTSDLATWITTEARVRNWKARSFNHMRLFLRGLFELAIADRIIAKSQNPFDAAIIKWRKPEPTFRYIPTVAQFEAIVAYARRPAEENKRGGSEEAARFMEMLGLAGVGQAELASMRVNDIREDHLLFVRQKTKRPFRVPIYAWLRPVVQVLREKHKLSPPETRVFSILDVKSPLDTACRKLGFPHFTQRNLRAMLIKRLHDEGIPAKQIALWQGHTDGGVLIQQVYTEVFCDSDRAAEEAYLALLEKPRGRRKFKVVK